MNNDEQLVLPGMEAEVPEEPEYPWPEAPEFGLTTPEHFRYADRVLLTPEDEGSDDFKREDGGLFLQSAALPIGIIVTPEHLAGRRVVYRKYHGDKVIVNGTTFLAVEPRHTVLFLREDDEVEEVGNG